jgi:hypothetical protein
MGFVDARYHMRNIGGGMTILDYVAIGVLVVLAVCAVADSIARQVVVSWRSVKRDAAERDTERNSNGVGKTV